MIFDMWSAYLSVGGTVLIADGLMARDELAPDEEEEVLNLGERSSILMDVEIEGELAMLDI